MQITVRFFAVLRDRAKQSMVQISLDPGTTVGSAAEKIAGDFPSLAPLLPRIGFAINQSVVDRSSLLSDGDELALIPPVSGGCR